MNARFCVEALSLPLPEDILKRKWAGDLEGAARAIDRRLRESLPDMLRARLIAERERLRRLPTQYPYDREQALQKLREAIPDLTQEEFDGYEDAGCVDFIYIGGQKRYFTRFHLSMLRMAAVAARAGKPIAPENTWLDPMIARVKVNGRMARRITLESALTLDKEAFEPGEYLIHLPCPALAAQQRDITLLSGDCDGVSDENAEARTAHWQRRLDTWRDVSVRYSYVSEILYADPLNAPTPTSPLYPSAEPPCEADLSEEAPYLRFTPYLRALAKDVTRSQASPARKARAIYDFITKNVQYSFMRDYFQIDDLGEYCAVNLRGDCGLQALLFILLCRIESIPARWQSGLSIGADGVDSHDWAQFYLDGWGWLFCDPSFGGSAYRCGAKERHDFYFGNLDPMRMVANSRFFAPLTPELTAFRFDPYDNQAGEIERVGAPLPFTGRQYDGDTRLIEVEDIE